MLKTGLEFAPGTTDDCKRQIGRMYTPEAILNAYRTARMASGTGDVVLVGTDQSPEIHGGSRMEYCAHLKQVFGPRARAFKMWAHSAASILKLPAEADAMWFVLDIRNVDLPIMCVIFALPYNEEARTSLGAA